jgi:hypothetical protein
VTIKSVCLDVNLTYIDLPENLDLPIEATLREILTGMYIAVKSPGEACDATLEVKAAFWPVWEEYAFENGGVSSCNSGGRVQGYISLFTSEDQKLVDYIDNTHTPDYIISCTQTASLSPGYWSAVWDEPIISGVINIWGPRAAAVVIDTGTHWDIALRSLTLMNEDISESIPQLVHVLEADKATHENKRWAAKALGAIGSQAYEAVPNLIQELKKTLTKIIEVGVESNSVSRDIELRIDLSSALFQITRAPCAPFSDFSLEEVECWQDWWETTIEQES